MRLVCPNCDAEYEVDAAAIPTAGRDVQCSNCGTSWFQPSLYVAAADADEAALFDAPHPVVTEAVPAKPRGLDETVIAVLREEAEREAAARRAELTQPMETQTELGLATAAGVASAESATAKRIARMKGADPDPRPPKTPQSRREMLPAIEEINSTLRATSERRTGEPASVAQSLPEPVRTTGGFRSGFVLMMVVATFAVMVYAMAVRIGQQIPGLAESLASYVEAVDSTRMWIDTLMKQAVSALRGLTA